MTASPLDCVTTLFSSGDLGKLCHSQRRSHSLPEKLRKGVLMRIQIYVTCCVTQVLKRWMKGWLRLEFAIRDLEVWGNAGADTVQPRERDQ